MLSKENYYTNPIDWQYVSVSQYKDFLKCEAAAMAKLKGEWEPKQDKTPLIVGNYVHSYFESSEAHAQFKEEHQSDLFSSKKPYGLLKVYQTAEAMIKKMEQDDFFQFLYQGEKEHILTGTLFGTEWKARIDCLNVDKGYFVDIKTTADMHKSFFSKKYGYRVSFIEEYGYTLQMAVYKYLLEQKFGKTFTPYIFAVSKETPLNIEALKINPEKLDTELNDLEQHIERMLAVKNEFEEPERCEHCEYCRLTKKVTGFIEIDDLIK